MNRILVINLKKFGDVFASGHLVTSLIKRYPQAKISLLTYKESSNAAWAIKGISSVYSIDRKKLLTIVGSPLFNNIHALSLMHEELKEIKAKEWDMVINLSNDPVATYLMSYVDSRKRIGTSFAQDKSTNYTNFWNKVFNDIVPSLQVSPFNFNELFHKMADVDFADVDNKAVNFPQNNAAVVQNFQRVRKLNPKFGTHAKIVGIQLKAGEENKEISKRHICEFIKFCLEYKEIIPVLLIADIESERAYANEIIDIIGSNIVSIESDFRTLPSVLQNIDLLLTPDTSVKHLADLTNTPVVEVSAGNSPLFKQSTIQEGSLIIRPINDEAESVQVTDLIRATHDSLGLNSKDIPYSANITVYRCERDNNSINYLPIAGNIRVQSEIHRLFSNEYIKSLYAGKDLDLNSITNTNIFTKAELFDWCQSQKQNLIDPLKELLSCIRALNSLKSTNKGISDFLSKLDGFIRLGDTNTINSIPIKLFSAELESLSSLGLRDNIETIESELFKVKAKIQALNNAYNNMTQSKEVSREASL